MNYAHMHKHLNKVASYLFAKNASWKCVCNMSLYGFDIICTYELQIVTLNEILHSM